MELGYGNQAYFDFHLYLIALFLILTVIAIPTYMIFVGFHDGNRIWSGYQHVISFGNMGHAQPLCKDIALGIGTLTLECPAGEIGEIGHFGITPSEARALDACIPNHESMECVDAYDHKYV